MCCLNISFTDLSKILPVRMNQTTTVLRRMQLRRRPHKADAFVRLQKFVERAGIVAAVCLVRIMDYMHLVKTRVSYLC